MELPGGPQTLDSPIFASHHSLQSIKDTIQANFLATELQTKPVTVSFVYNPNDLLGSVPDRILGMREGPLDQEAAQGSQAGHTGEQTDGDQLTNHVVIAPGVKSIQMMSQGEARVQSPKASTQSMDGQSGITDASLGNAGEMVWWVDPQGNYNLVPVRSQGGQLGQQ